MADVQYRGRTSGGLYSFDIGVIPPELLDQWGNQHSGIYNGELCIPSNHDGSVLNPQATGNPVDQFGNPIGGPQSIYDAYVHFPAWWSQDPDEQF